MALIGANCGQTKDLPYESVSGKLTIDISIILFVGASCTRAWPANHTVACYIHIFESGHWPQLIHGRRNAYDMFSGLIVFDLLQAYQYQLEFHL